MPVIGDVDVGAAVPEPSVRLRLPVLQKGMVRYVITVPLKPDAFADVLRAQRLPESWVIALVDRNRRFIARLPPMPPAASGVGELPRRDRALAERLVPGRDAGGNPDLHALRHLRAERLGARHRHPGALGRGRCRPHVRRLCCRHRGRARARAAAGLVHGAAHRRAHRRARRGHRGHGAGQGRPGSGPGKDRRDLAAVRGAASRRRGGARAQPAAGARENRAAGGRPRQGRVPRHAQP